MANQVTIDLSTPEMREALAECDPGETHSLTMEITVEEKNGSLIGVVNPQSIEKYGEDYEEEEETSEDVEGDDSETPKAIAILLNKGEA
tara:strand:- start:1914 stop:2180 length:267 start_codon:yes stop_codon:yes gene_type:complete